MRTRRDQTVCCQGRRRCGALPSVERGTTMALHGGPTDGETVDVGALTEEELAGGLALISPKCSFFGGRCIYSLRDDGQLYWDGDTA
ncbi:hypothetical protein [Streptomyces gobiensis]|uniref:hypothetical protein n=1 Tax=Streptomyces gobiensis TaxID=2875706 RepID=UPI001E29A93C|nr:hypothetical protein [Streptomyces gobiensis]UGY91340.1 hypothetical protein test1122_06145 [Streptomyces gobiensis]